MKKVFTKLFLPFAVLGVIMSCEDTITDSFDILDIAPVIDEVSASGAIALGTEFDITIKVSDGENSPLASISVALSDTTRGIADFATTTGTVSGTSDSLVWAAADFGSTGLDTGVYEIEVTVTDAANLSVTESFYFEIFDAAFQANNSEMYILGSMNGWGGTDLEMELIADNTWYVEEVAITAGDEFKFANTSDFSGEDWTDDNCDLTCVPAAGNPTNIACGYSGTFNVTFNDETLVYSLESVVMLEQNLDDLYLLGSFNNFDGDDYRFALDDDNTWILEEVLLAPGDAFKFSDSDSFSGNNWGDNEPDSIADLFGSTIVMPESIDEAFYRVTFNDSDFSYSLEFVKFPSIGIIGSATPTGWDSDTDLNDDGDGTFSMIIPLTAGEVKFRANDEWTNNWGATDFPSGTGTLNGPNIPVDAAGLYIVDFNPSTGEYTFTSTNVGIIGSATPGGWDADTDMTMDAADPAIWTINITLTDGESKFRANDDWAYNWGAGDFPSGTATSGGANIPTTAGTYDVTFNVWTGEYSFN